MTAARPKAGERATCKRYAVVALGFAISFITYLDRAAIGQAAPAIATDLHLSTVQMGYVFAVFGLAYAAFELPSGWLGDWLGPRKVLLRIVLWWSFFTAATGWAWNYGSLLVTRFLFGIGEAGCFPNLAKCFSIWLPHTSGCGPKASRPPARAGAARSRRCCSSTCSSGWGGAASFRFSQP